MFSLSDLAILGAAQGLMLTIAILSITFGNRRANRFLAAFVAAVSLRLFVIAMEYQAGAAHRWHDAFFTLLHLSYLIGPLLYFYVRLLVQPDWPLQARQLLHLLPVVIAALALLPGGLIVAIEHNNYDSFESLPAELQAKIALASTPVFISLIVYSLMSLQQLGPYQQAIKEQFSAIESINLNWLKTLIYFCIALAAVSVVSELLRALTTLAVGPRAAYSVVLSVVMIYFIGLMGLRQPLIFDQGQREPANQQVTQRVAPASETTTASGDGEQKYQKSCLDEERVEALWQKLQALMAAQQPYLEPGIKLADLAKLVSTRPNYLSPVINSKAGESFFDYINRHRIEAATALLIGQAHLSVSDIAQAAGFNSQNVFNGHFKKHLGMTPSQFRKQHT